MKFELSHAIEVLERTPSVLRELLSGLSDEWTRINEGGESWSPFDVVGHLIHGEKTDWLSRVSIILEKGTSTPFTPFDRFAMLKDNVGRALHDLLNEFAVLRAKNIDRLKLLGIDRQKLALKGTHPALGEVTLEELLSTWAAHDLNHIAQICRVMATQYKENVGPWAEYLRIMNS